jgi:germination protein M
MRSAAASALVVLALAAAGCGGSEDETSGNPPAPPPPTTEPTTGTETTPGPIGGTPVGVYFVRDGKLGFAERSVGPTPKVATAALEELLGGPTASEQEAGLASDVPQNTKLQALAIKDGTARVELSNPLDALGTAQVVQTLLQFETVDRVELEGAQREPADVEEFLPAILVESPAPGAEVSSPLKASGTANTFEANFQAEVVETGGKSLAKDFVTATSGSGQRGTFEFELDFFADRQKPGKLIVYERSAEDGSVINKVEIPVTLTP